MRKSLTLLSIMLCSTLVYSQNIPNGNFEGPPFDWVGEMGGTTAIGGRAIVSISSETTDTLFAAEGSIFARMVNNSGIGGIQQQFAYSSRPKSLRGFCAYLPGDKDEVAAIVVIMTKFNSTTMTADTLLNDSILITKGSYPWKEVAIDLDDKYRMAGNPDTAYIGVFNSVTSVVTSGTFLAVDYLRFSEFSSSVNNKTSPFSQIDIFPNPSRESTNLSFELLGNEPVYFQIMDMTGKVQKTYLYENHQSGVLHQIDLRDLTPGMYICALTTLNGRATERLLVN